MVHSNVLVVADLQEMEHIALTSMNAWDVSSSTVIVLFVQLKPKLRNRTLHDIVAPIDMTEIEGRAECRVAEF